MNRLRFFIVDVFATEKYNGNQLAVFLIDKAIPDLEMQRIAKEMNYSETTFLMCDDKENNTYNARIFTPEHEVPFAGHPTLGTAHIIRTILRENSFKEIILNLKVGEIPVKCIMDKENIPIYWMKQIEPSFGEKFQANDIAPVLGLDFHEIDDYYPIEEVSTGLPHIIVPLKNLNSLKKAKISRDKYFDLIKNTWAKNILIFCPQSHYGENDISVRMFADYLGIPEDPATGSGNGCLAGYIVRYSYFSKNKIHIRSEQGYEIGRPSLLHLIAEESAGKIDISVGGSAVTIADGYWLV